MRQEQIIKLLLLATNPEVTEADRKWAKSQLFDVRMEIPSNDIGQAALKLANADQAKESLLRRYLPELFNSRRPHL